MGGAYSTYEGFWVVGRLRYGGVVGLGIIVTEAPRSGREYPYGICTRRCRLEVW